MKTEPTLRIRYDITLVIEVPARVTYSAQEIENVAKRTFGDYGLPLAQVVCRKSVDGAGRPKRSAPDAD